MFHGMIEGRNPAVLSVTIKTNFGQMLPFSTSEGEVIKGVEKGDRVGIVVNALGIVVQLQKSISDRQ